MKYGVSLSIRTPPSLDGNADGLRKFANFTGEDESVELWASLKLYLLTRHTLSDSVSFEIVLAADIQPDQT